MHPMMSKASPQAKWTMFVIFSGLMAIGAALYVSRVA